VAQLVESIGAGVISATGTDRGNEVMAHVAAMLDVAFVSNCLHISPGAVWELTRVRWGGSLHERAALDSALPIVTFAPFTTEAAPLESASEPTTAEFTPALDASHALTLVQDRVTREEGLTLATAPIVVSGGRGVGSEDGFAPLEELAEQLGGVVGCSRVVTNNGWRNHRFQVGQTGTVVAPDVYIACGISGAIQHWVGMMNSKHILAINTDEDAPMVTKADWAIIADLHEVVPAITAELRRRRT
jgi:electron transfer flavoprotein alpha subunit